MMPLRTVQNEEAPIMTIGALKPEAPLRRGGLCKASSERVGGVATTEDRRAAWAARGKSISEKSPSFSKIDVHESPLSDDISIATVGTAVSALTFGEMSQQHESSASSYANRTDLCGYVSELRGDMMQAKEEARLMREANEAAASNGSSDDSSSEVEKYKSEVENLQAELAAVNRRLEEQNQELQRRQEQEQLAPAFTPPTSCPLSAITEIAVPLDGRPKSGPWRRLARRIAKGGTPPSSTSTKIAASMSSSRSVVSSAGSVVSRNTSATAPAHLQPVAAGHEEEDPRLGAIASLRELLRQIEFQNALRDQSIQSLDFTRSKLEADLDGARHEQLRLTEQNAADEEGVVELRRHMDEDLAGEVSALRKRVEKNHRKVEVLKRKVALWSPTTSSSTGGGESQRRLQAGGPRQQQQGERRTSRRRDQRASFADVRYLLARAFPPKEDEGTTALAQQSSSDLAQSSEGREYRRQAAHQERTRRREGRASFADHLHKTHRIAQQDRADDQGRKAQHHAGHAARDRTDDADSPPGAQQGAHQSQPVGAASRRNRRSQRASLADLGSVLSSAGGLFFGGGGGNGRASASLNNSAPDLRW